MADTESYLWTDQFGRTYASLRFRAGHWQVEWGHRDPPGGDHYLEEGKHETSVKTDAIQIMLTHIGLLSGDPGEAARVEHELRETLPA